MKTDQSHDHRNYTLIQIYYIRIEGSISAINHYNLLLSRLCCCVWLVSHVSTYWEQKRSGQPSENSFGCLTLAGAFKKGSQRPITGSVIRCRCVHHACGCAGKTALSLYQQNYNFTINTKCSVRMHQQHFGAHFCSHWLVKNPPVLQVVCDKLWPPYQIMVGNNTRHSVWKLKWLFEKGFSFHGSTCEDLIYLDFCWTNNFPLQTLIRICQSATYLTITVWGATGGRWRWRRWWWGGGAGALLRKKENISA